MNTLSWQQFTDVDLRIGTIIRAEEFPEARKPAYKLFVDFGAEVGVRQSSAQITVHYTLKELVGKQIIGVVNFPPKQIGKFMSDCLVTGFYQEDGSVILAVPDKTMENGVKLG